MTTFNIKRAVKRRSKLRLLLIGPSNSGKTYTALTLATGLGKKVCVIDSEHGSASKYADKFAFDVLELESFSPDDYASAIKAAESAGYDVIVVDSLSHAWAGKDGALEQVDKIAAKLKSANTFGAWREVTPMQNRMVDAIVGCRSHIICTCRSKMEYVLEKDERTGKMIPRKLGMAPVQRDGLEYEFDFVGDIDHAHTLTVTKTRIPQLDGMQVNCPGRDFVVLIDEWMSQGEEPPISQRQLDRIKELIRHKGVDEAWQISVKDRYKIGSAADLNESQAESVIAELEAR